MKKKSLREEILEIIDNGESWIDVRTGKSYHRGNRHELPKEEDFVQGDEEQTQALIDDIEAQMAELFLKKQRVTKEASRKTVASVAVVNAPDSEVADEQPKSKRQDSEPASTSQKK